MKPFLVFFVILFLSAIGFWRGKARSTPVAGVGRGSFHSLPVYYGLYVALWIGIPAFLVASIWFLAEETIISHMVLSSLPEAVLWGGQGEISSTRSLILNGIHNAIDSPEMSSLPPDVSTLVEQYVFLKQISVALCSVVSLAVAIFCGVASMRWVTPRLRARARVESVVKCLMGGCAAVAILVTVGIVSSLLFESGRFFSHVPILDFLFGLEWSPHTALRSDQVGASGHFGAIPLFTGTLLISAVAMVIAAPVGLMAAIYTAEYASPRVRAFVKPALEVLAGIPTVVYGFFAALTVAPFFRNTGLDLGLVISSESALAAGLVMGIMIIPFVSSLSDDVISAVPRSLREGSYGLGATRSETICRVVLPAALPGVVGSLLLAVSRAIGETMIVVMAAGLAANLTANPFEAVTTVTVQIVTLLVGDQEFDSAKTLSAFALGLVLFVMTLALNVVALRVVRKYREQYE